MGNKMRVHELAKKLGMSNDEILEILTGEGIDVKSHLSAMDEESVEYVLELYGADLAEGPEEEDEVIYDEKELEKPKKLKKAGKKSKVKAEKVDVPASEDPDAPGYIDGDEIHFRPPFILKQLASVLDVKVNMLIMELMQKGVMANLNQSIPSELATELCEHFG